jgi:N-formylglutamate deformylase
MKLPILLSVPHAGGKIPPEVADICRLTDKDVREDGDEGADEIYYPLKNEVTAFVTTDVARAVIDLSRAPGDFRKDGIIKTHTCWDVPVYRIPPLEEAVSSLLQKYYYPYHQQLKDLSKHVKLGIDGHTMAAFGPPVGPDSGKERPPVCISNAGFTCPDSWIQSLAESLEHSLSFPVSINTPFQGGYIVRSHAAEIPWIQVEFSRADFLPNSEKSLRFLDALRKWLDHLK